MSDGFVKIYGDQLLNSTVWVQTDIVTKVVWIILLTLADRHGNVKASIPGIARLASASIEDTVRSLETLKAPDEWSRTKDHEGRRLEEIDGGWNVLNYTKYRDYRTTEQIRAAERKADWRAAQ